MAIQLCVAMSGDVSVGARAILESLGALLAEGEPGRLRSEDAACLVLTRPDECAAYIGAGGVLLAPKDCWPRGWEPVETIVTPFAADDLGWRTTSGAARPPSADFSFDVARVEHGFCVELPRPLFDEQWLNRDIGLKRMCAGDGPDDFYTEATSLLNKQNIQKTVLLALQKCYSLRGLPCLLKSRFPTGASNIFCYRLDCDGGAPDDFRSTVHALADDIPHQAWFFNVYQYRRMPDLATLVQSHGGAVESHSFVHYVFPDAERETRNIRAAHEWIARHTGREPRGFSCPNFGYNDPAIQLLESLNYRVFHSFGMDYDTLPHRVVHNGRLTGLWNIAYHPISIGRMFLRLGGFNQGAMNHYWSSLAAVRQRRHEPHFYYCHPEGRVGKYPQIYHAIRAAVMGFPGVRRMDLQTYAGFLDRRTALAPNLSYDRHTRRAMLANADEWRKNDVSLLACDCDLRPIDATPVFEVGPSDSAISALWTLGVGDTIASGREQSQAEARNAITALKGAADAADFSLRHPDLCEALMNGKSLARRVIGQRFPRWSSVKKWLQGLSQGTSN